MLVADIDEVRDTLARRTHRLIEDDLLRARVQRRLALMFPDDIDPRTCRPRS